MKNNIPSVRFSKELKEYESVALEKVAIINPKSSIPKKFKYVDLESVIETKLISYREESKETAPSRAQRLAIQGDIFYQTVRPYQKNNLLFNLVDTDYVFSSGYAQLRPSINGYYLFSQLQNSRFVTTVLEQCTGTSYPAINSNTLSKIEIMISNDTQEHQKIGSFFKNLDDTIALHQQELEALKQTKQGFLQKMFPKNEDAVPEIRLKGFTDEWTLCELKNVATFINGRAYKQNELLDSGKYKVLRVGNFYTNTSWYYSDLELGEKYYANFGDLLYTWSASFGPHIWKGDKVIYHYHIWRVDLKDGFDKHFIVQLFEYDKAKIMSDKNGSTMVHITKKGMEEKIVRIPSYDEQIKIGEFFRQLDEVIELKEKELEALKETKKGFLQKMFV